MNDSESYLCYIEKLTVCSWLFFVFPHFLKQSRKSSCGVDDVTGEKLLYYVDASQPGILLSRLMARSINLEIKHLDFTLFDAKDEIGDLLWWKVIFEDLGDIQNHFKTHPEFQKAIKNYNIEDKKLFFLMRRVLYFEGSPFTLARILLLIRIATIKKKSKDQKSITMFILSWHRPWLTEVETWAKKRNVQIIDIGGGFNQNCFTDRLH